LDGFRSLLFEIFEVGDVVESLNLLVLEEESEFGHDCLKFEYSDEDFLEMDEFFIFFEFEFLDLNGSARGCALNSDVFGVLLVGHFSDKSGCLNDIYKPDKQ
jgi:hypothetical protein